MPDSDATTTPRPRAPAPPDDPAPSGAVLVTSGNVFHQAWALSWPSALANLLQLLIFLSDAFYVGLRNDPTELAALGTGQQLVWVMIAVGMALVVGTTALVARFVGAQEVANAATAARQCLLLAGVSSVLIAAPLWAFRRQVLVVYGLPEIVEPAAAYLVPVILSLPFFFGMLVVTAIFRGMGDMKTPLGIMAAATVVSVAFGYPVIVGTPAITWGGLDIPARAGMGVAGAGYTAAAGRVVAFLMAWWWLRRTALWHRIARSWRPNAEWFGRIIRIGYPAALQHLSRTAGAIVYLRLLAGTTAAAAAIAAFTIGIRIEGLGFMPGLAFGLAAITMVGQNLGARAPQRAAQSGWACAGQAAVLMSAVGVGLLVFAEPVVRLFTTDAQTIYLGAAYLRINALSMPLLALWMVLSQGLQGAGDTRFPAAVTILAMWALRLPMTYVLVITLGLGAVSAWWAMFASTVLGGLLVTWRYRSGRWQTTQV